MNQFRRGTKRLIKRMLGYPLQRFVDRAGGADIKAKLEKIEADLHNPPFLLGGMDKKAQIALTLQYHDMRCRQSLPSFADIGFQAFSQTDEDGILLYIFALIGTTNRKCVEACVGDGIECNTANLIIHHGWDGLLLDGDADKLARGRAFYDKNPCTWIVPPRLVHAWIDRDNINTIITKHGYSGEVDLLSLDLDGVDYWIWKALDCINPRVVVVECQPGWGPEMAVTVPYRPDFIQTDLSTFYFGASLPAFVRLAQEKGYRLVGSNRYGFNAFFIRNGVGEEWLPEISIEAYFEQPRLAEMQYITGDREWPGPWEQV